MFYEAVLSCEAGIGRLTAASITILLIVFVQMIGTAMVHPILPLYAQSEFSLSPEVITLLLTAFFAAQFVAGPFIGRLSDRRGRLPVLLLSQAGTVLAFSDDWRGANGEPALSPRAFSTALPAAIS